MNNYEEDGVLISQDAIENSLHKKAKRKQTLAQLPVYRAVGNLKYVMRLYEKDELYDLEKDPKELVNRIDETEYQGDIAKMRSRLLQWYMETADWVPNRKDPRF